MHKIWNRAGELHKISGGIWVSIATSFMLFLYAPLELLFTNMDEFWFDAYILTSVMIVVFVIGSVVSILAFVLLYKINEILYRFGLMLYFAGFICLYVQGNILNAGLPPLSGEHIDWSMYPAEQVKSIILWGGVFSAALAVTILCKVKTELLEKFVKLISICMTVILGVTILTLALTNGGFEKKPSMSVTDRAMFDMSPDSNFVILLLDAVDADTMNSMIETDAEYRDIFTDFTSYSNVMGAYPYTKHSIPFILSGEWFENETAYREYAKEAYGNSPFLKTLEERDYQMGGYEISLPLDDAGIGRFENVLPNVRGVSDKLTFARWQILMTGFKYAPYDLKRFSFVNPNAFGKLKIPPEGETLFTESNTEFYDKVLHEEIHYVDRKCFRFIHIEGGHVPFIYDENVNVIENGTYEMNLQACLTMTKAYLTKLKESGVYDNSVIIVMSDHGFNGLEVQGRQNPFFCVKGINERHELETSDAPISFVDLQEAYQRLLSGADGGSIFDWKSGDLRERRYLYHEYSKEDYMVEYIQPGQADDTNAMYETGNVYSR